MEIIERFDQDGDGAINVTEFIAWSTAQQREQQQQRERQRQRQRQQPVARSTPHQSPRQAKQGATANNTAAIITPANKNKVAAAAPAATGRPGAVAPLPAVEDPRRTAELRALFASCVRAVDGYACVCAWVRLSGLGGMCANVRLNLRVSARLCLFLCRRVVSERVSEWASDVSIMLFLRMRLVRALHFVLTNPSGRVQPASPPLLARRRCTMQVRRGWRRAHLCGRVEGRLPSHGTCDVACGSDGASSSSRHHRYTCTARQSDGR